ncbi:unnamed protein product [Cuscuta campestris]|uniref:Uncharacterized protein n=1 Tax=Cuscuta campestris TaxID=132261 RepID=A0A484KTG3_9ASTE|nr:unnamed protein product [Cuscuta campestris]
MRKGIKEILRNAVFLAQLRTHTRRPKATTCDLIPPLGIYDPPTKPAGVVIQPAVPAAAHGGEARRLDDCDHKSRRPQKQEDDKKHWGQVGDELAPDITGEPACDSRDESASECRAENRGSGRSDGREHLQVAGVFLSFGNPLKYEPKDEH